MANLLQSNQQVQTTAPDYYTNYLSGIANQGQNAVNNAQYIGSQPLQNQAFGDIASTAGSTQPSFNQGQNLVDASGNVANNISNSASGYLQAGTQNNPLSALQPYANNAMAYTGTQAGAPDINAGTSLSGLNSASPYLSGAANANSANVSGQYVNQATGMNTVNAANPYLYQASQRPRPRTYSAWLIL